MFDKLYFYYQSLMYKITRLFKKFYEKLNLSFGLVNPLWALSINIPLFFTKKIKVGFGPIVTSEFNLAARKWRIDPVINEINKYSAKYKAGYFFHEKDMAKFDIIVIVKRFTEQYIPVIADLKLENKRFIYDIVDNPRAHSSYKCSYMEYTGFTSLMDGFILSSPLHELDIKSYSNKYMLIEHPVINQLYAGHVPFKLRRKKKDEIYILTQGVHKNIKNIFVLLPLLEEISIQTGKKICLIYHSEKIFPDRPYVKFIRWSVENSFGIMQCVDIAISIKELSDKTQSAKPSTKIVAFMAAGLPIVCVPTAADSLVIHDGENGFFVNDNEDWKKVLTQLIQDSKYRERIGQAAKASVIEKYSIRKMTEKYIKLFDSVNS